MLEEAMRAEGFAIPRWRSRDESVRWSLLRGDGVEIRTPEGEERRAAFEWRNLEFPATLAELKRKREEGN